MTATVSGYLWCLLASLASASATYLIKLSNQTGSDWTMARLLYLGAACAAYGFGFIGYTIALQKLPVTLAYPLMTAITMCLILLTGYALLGESVTPIRMLGMALIAAGTFALTR